MEQLTGNDRRRHIEFPPFGSSERPWSSFCSSERAPRVALQAEKVPETHALSVQLLLALPSGECALMTGIDILLSFLTLLLWWHGLQGI